MKRREEEEGGEKGRGEREEWRRGVKGEEGRRGGRKEGRRGGRQAMEGREYSSYAPGYRRE